MSQESQVTNWDDFTPEQKHLYQAWIKSLENTKAASIELIKCFNNEEITSKAANTLSIAESSETLNFNSLEVNDRNLPQIPDVIDCVAELVKCNIGCAFSDNPQKCLEDCKKNFSLCGS